ncbi:MAG: carboxylating nicotinate-nucleotide diphosphorylase [Hydrogenophilaceae bacterium]|nr:carboxylating nicotinate-nucleotide diphosphorylase [Hydrogenophilaceae bacterium]
MKASLIQEVLLQAIEHNVSESLAEDIGTGDLTASLLSASQSAHARVISREDAILCGIPWFETCFRKLDPQVVISWHAREGERIYPNQLLCDIDGNARALLTAERPALNFLQTLSGTATLVRRYTDAIAGTDAVVMDTRKTLPGLRIAQKYAIATGGGANQRIGLYDGILIKENHIASAGGIRPVLEAAFALKVDVPIQIEVESLDELKEAIDAGAKLILIDNFSLDEMREAVNIARGHAVLEASGNITLDNVRDVALTGVQRISIGSLTKHVRAVDLSMRVQTK